MEMKLNDLNHQIKSYKQIKKGEKFRFLFIIYSKRKQFMFECCLSEIAFIRKEREKK